MQLVERYLFLKITNDIALAVDQLGTRKGAIAVYLEPWHMDIVDFIDLKKILVKKEEELWFIPSSLDYRFIYGESFRRFSLDIIWPYEVKDLSECYGDEFKAKYIAYENDETITKNTMKAKDLWKKF